MTHRKNSPFIKSRAEHNPREGFTLIELLVVISIISLLSSIVFSALNSAREKAKVAKARAELHNARNALALLELDTGKWPNGCIPFTSTNPEAFLDNMQSGLVGPAPLTGTPYAATPEWIDDFCVWTAADVAKWKGPYMNIGKDPWGTPYQFDPDYWTGRNSPYNVPPTDPCFPGYVNSSADAIPAVVSFGPNKLGGYDCDNIYIELEKIK